MSTGAPQQDRPRQEPGDLEPRIVLLSVASIVVMLVLATLIAYLVHQLSGPTRNSPENAQTAQATHLASDPGSELAAFERAKQTRLRTYGWADPQHRTAHIPIDTAMQRLAERSSAPNSEP